MTFKIVASDSMCKACRYAEMEELPLTSDAPVSERIVSCKHEHICERAYEYGRRSAENGNEN